VVRLLAWVGTVGVDTTVGNPRGLQSDAVAVSLSPGPPRHRVLGRMRVPAADGWVALD
jgi:hypothetical protein